MQLGAFASIQILCSKNYEDQGLLASKEKIGWRAAIEDERPQPAVGEVVVFLDHLLRGFSPPRSKIFRDVLHFYNLHPQDLAPNSISNLCQFQVFCEAYMQMESTVLLFREFFYLNRQTECADGPSQELGGISIQRRRDCGFPAAVLPSHPKGWVKTWFYCRNTAPDGENPLPGYRADRLPMNFELPGPASPEERSQLAPLWSKFRALTANGLTGVDLTRCWVSWRILPLSHRDTLMCTYDGDLNNVQRYSNMTLENR